MNIASLRARVRSLRRRMALPYAQVMLQRQADDLCTQWAVAQADKRPTPSPPGLRPPGRRGGFPSLHLHRRRPLP